MRARTGGRAGHLVEISIARAADDVFDFLRDYSNEAKWQSRQVSSVVVEPPGPARVGTRAHKVRRTSAGQQRFTVEITEMDTGSRRWVDVICSGPFRGSTGSWEVLDEPPGCRVRLQMRMHAVGPWRVLLPVVDRVAANDLRSEFANLKRLLEDATPGAATRP